MVTINKARNLFLSLCEAQINWLWWKIRIVEADSASIIYGKLKISHVVWQTISPQHKLQAIVLFLDKLSWAPNWEKGGLEINQPNNKPWLCIVQIFIAVEGNKNLWSAPHPWYMYIEHTRGTKDRKCTEWKEILCVYEQQNLKRQACLIKTGNWIPFVVMVLSTALLTLPH